MDMEEIKKLDSIIQKREVITSKEKTKLSIISDFYINASYVIAPIITSSDVVGAVIIFSTADEIDDFMIKTGIIASKFLGKYIE